MLLSSRCSAARSGTAPGTAPDLSSSGATKPGSVAEASSELVFDKPGYDAFLKKKALLAPARGRQLLMTV